MRMLVCLAACMCLAIPAIGATWHVAKDGSGDFSVIQDAVNAAASGDTIRIGPGRYDDKHLIGNPPWQQFARFHVVQQQLTIVGAGQDRTVIGPAQAWTAIQGDDSGAYVSGYYGAAVVRIEGLRFENTSKGIASVSGIDSLLVARCSFGGHRMGVNTDASYSDISGSRFEGAASASYFHLGTFSADVLRVDGSGP